MKVLDVANLTNGMNQLNKTIDNKQKSMVNVQEDIKAVIELNAFTGEGAEAIKAFYEDCHVPFLKSLQMAYDEYKQLLSSCQSSLKAFEASPQGRIVEPFLSTNVYNDLERLLVSTVSMVTDGNTIISSVEDIVSLPKLDDSEVLSTTSKAKSFVGDTLTNLHAFDREQTVAFKELFMNLTLLNNYILEIDNRFKGGELSIHSYSSTQLWDFESQLQLDSLFNNQEYKNDQLKLRGMQEFRDFNRSYTDLGVFYTEKFNKVDLEDKPIEKKEVKSVEKKEDKTEKKKEDINYIAGKTEKLGDFTFSGGAGEYKNDWKFDLQEQIGGESSFSLVGTTVKHDTGFLDTSFEHDILKGEVKAGVGGTNVFPVAKAQGVIYGTKARTEFDDNTWAKGFGGEVTGNIGTGTAYIGVDNASVGVAAKTAVAEGEISGFMKIPWTDYNFKSTLGGSALGVGGEFKVGKEFVIDLRFLLGVKIALSFEKDE